MAYTFGGTTADDINLGMAIGAGGSASVSLHMGWFYPTTLTSGRYYWSAGNTVGLGIDATTSELTWTTANATTSGVWKSTTAAITTNKWHFIATLETQNNTGPAMACKAIVYDDVNGWRDATMAQTTAPVGNFTAGTALTLGNRGTGTVAFQGDIDSFVAIHAGTPSTRGVLRVATAGAIAADEWTGVIRQLIMPCMQGTLDIQQLVASGYGNSFEVATFHFHGGAWTRRWHTTSLTVGLPTVSTVNAAVRSEARAPGIIPANWEMGTMVARR